ncbi:MAG: hypothetical protein AAGA30_21810 [Planctomycetota bacterium]
MMKPRQVEQKQTSVLPIFPTSRSTLHLGQAKEVNLPNGTIASSDASILSGNQNSPQVSQQACA